MVGAQGATAAERVNVIVHRAYRISQSSRSLDSGITHVLPPRELLTHKCEELKNFLSSTGQTFLIFLKLIEANLNRVARSSTS